MTALPTDLHQLNLICDACGYALNGINASMRDWDVAWALVTRKGWTGSPLPIGPHRCPTCSAASPDRHQDGRLTRSPGPLRADVRSVADTGIVELHGDLDTVVHEELQELLARVRAVHRHLILDLGDVRVIDSVCLGLLVRTQQRTAQSAGTLCLVTPSRAVVALLRTTHLYPMFPIFGEEREALRWLADHGDGASPR
jgi:anti-sigma B factor antagonist